MNNRLMKNYLPTRRAFTLVEILIVVVILGILAAIVIPQVGSTVSESQTSSLRMNLNTIRKQIEFYKNQHAGLPSLENIDLQLTSFTDGNGNTNDVKTPVFKFGPYLRNIPNNPYTGRKDISTDEVGTSDWFYDPATGKFHANDTDESRAY